MMPHAYVMDAIKGFHPLLAQEFARALGDSHPKCFTDQVGLPLEYLYATCFHICHSLLTPNAPVAQTHGSVSALPATLPTATVLVGREGELATWECELQDLAELGQWFQEQLASLHQVMQAMANGHLLWEEGLATL